MRVITNPGTHSEEQRALGAVMWEVLRARPNGPAAMGALIELLVEKGVLTLADCRALGAPFMVQAP